jgi:Tfp pilus assembly protein PilO
MTRRLPLIVLLLMALLGAGWWMLLISPRNAEIGRLEDALGAALEEETRLRIQIRDLQAVLDREVEYLTAVTELETLIPDIHRLDELIEQIHQISLDTGIRLVSMTPAEPAPVAGTADLRQISVGLRVEGEFFQLLGFLFGLSDLERLVRVDTVSINSTTPDGLTVTRLIVALQVRAFTLGALLPEVLEPLPPIEGTNDEAEEADADDEADAAGPAAGGDA